jgi:rod shape determining protein RodA
MYRKVLSGNFLILGLLSIVLFVLALLFELPDLLMAILALSMMVYVMLFSNWKALAYSLLFFIGSYLALNYFEVISPIELLALMTLLAVGMMIYFNRHREIKDRKQRISLMAMSVVSMWFIFTVGYIFNNVLQEHQRTRITVLLGEEGKLEDQITELSARYHEMDENNSERTQLRQDIKEKKESLSNLKRGAGWNVNQSKIAIGSGGIAGKGFLQGTQTKGNFVPEQSTDFIFCTVGEEWGFLGSGLVVLLFVVLLVRLVFAAERQKTEFAKVYGYSLASIIFIHFSINIAMTLGLAPVIGIPLPMFSYGGSSLWAFTLLYFTFINLDAHRTQELGQ